MAITYRSEQDGALSVAQMDNNFHYLEDQLAGLTNSGSGAYVIDGANNPTLTLVRGQTYFFTVNATGHPFWIQTVSGGYSAGNVYNTGVTNNGTASGGITFTVAAGAPSTLYYYCQFHSSMGGTISIIG